jgi:hypothetical protein
MNFEVHIPTLKDALVISRCYLVHIHVTNGQG